MPHIVCILEPYLTYGTWHNLVTQNCTQGFAGPCTTDYFPCFMVCLASFVCFYLNSDIFPFTEECGIPPDSFVGRDAGGGHSRGGAVVYHGPVVHIALGLPACS